MRVHGVFSKRVSVSFPHGTSCEPGLTCFRQAVRRVGAELGYWRRLVTHRVPELSREGRGLHGPSRPPHAHRHPCDRVAGRSDGCAAGARLGRGPVVGEYPRRRVRTGPSDAGRGIRIPPDG